MLIIVCMLIIIRVEFEFSPYKFPSRISIANQSTDKIELKVNYDAEFFRASNVRNNLNLVPTLETVLVIKISFWF